MNAHLSGLFASQFGSSIHMFYKWVVMIVHVAAFDALHPPIRKGVLDRDAFRRIKVHHLKEETLRCGLEGREDKVTRIIAFLGHLTTGVALEPSVKPVDVLGVLCAFGDIRLVPQRSAKD